MHPLPLRPPHAALSRAHLKRLRAVWRSAGWPAQDTIEIELLAAGLIERLPSTSPDLRPDTIRLTDAGVDHLAQALAAGKRATSAHDTLCRRVAGALSAQGRLAWLGLSLLAPAAERPMSNPAPKAWGSAVPSATPTNTPQSSWVRCRPDVFSIRPSSLEHALEPTVFEIKVSRADLLSDLRHEAKGAAYLSVAQRCWMVLGCNADGQPIGEASEVPESFGVMIATPDQLDIARPAKAQRHRPVPLQHWLALARSTPFAAESEPHQLPL